MIGQASEEFRKELLSDKRSGERPQLVIAADEAALIDYKVDHRSSGDSQDNSCRPTINGF